MQLEEAETLTHLSDEERRLITAWDEPDTDHFARQLNDARAENEQLQKTVDAMQAEGCAAIGVLERIFVGLTAQTSPDAAVLKEMTEVAAETLATAAQCDHKAENERLLRSLAASRLLVVEQRKVLEQYACLCSSFDIGDGSDDRIITGCPIHDPDFALDEEKMLERLERKEA